MIRPKIDKSAVAPDIVNAIRIGPRPLGGGEIMSAHLPRLFRRKPLLACVGVIADEFFLFGIHRDHGTALLQEVFHGSIDMAELRVAVGMVLPFLRLPIALQTVVELVEDLGDRGVADGMPAPRQGLGNCPRALRNPPQGDSGSPRVCESIIASKVSTSRGSDMVIGLRPAPGRRILPSHATPASISWIPLAIAFRDSPHARRTKLTPP